MQTATSSQFTEYTATFSYSDEDECFVGHVVDIDDIVGFHGDSEAEMQYAFEEAVDDYIETCKKLNRAPQTPPHRRVLSHWNLPAPTR